VTFDNYTHTDGSCHTQDFYPLYRSIGCGFHFGLTGRLGVATIGRVPVEVMIQLVESDLAEVRKIVKKAKEVALCKNDPNNVTRLS
jgi:hypothetical protein